MDFPVRNWSQDHLLFQGNASDEDEPNIFYNPVVKYSLVVAYSIVFLFCFFGNLLVVLVTCLHRRMQSMTKFSLGNLAVANLCVGVFCIYQNLSLYIFNSWIFGEFMCKMYHFVNSLSYTASILILVVNSLERYLAILHPFLCRRLLTKRRLKCTIIGVWLVSGIICAPKLYYMRILRREIRLLPEDKNLTVYLICTPLPGLYDVESSDLVQLFLLYLLPLGIITPLYIRLGFYLRAQERLRNKIAPESRGGSFNSTDVHRVSRRRTPNVRDGASPDLQSFRFLYKLAKSRSKPNQSSFRSLDSPTMIRATGTDPVLAGTRYERRRSSSLLGRREPSRKLYEYKRIVRMLTTVVLTFAVCNLPYHVRKMYQNYATDPDLESNLSELLTPLTFLFMYMNCALNPFIYGFMSKTFRACILEFLKCNFGRQTSARNTVEL